MKRKGTNPNKKSKKKKHSQKYIKEEESTETINKHCPKKENFQEKKKQELTEKEINEKLKEIYSKIEKKDFSNKPEYLNMTTYNNLSKEHKECLEKLSAITGYILISPIELLYKQQYEEINKISNEKDKCSICQYNFYEEEENEKEVEEKNEKNTFEKYLKTEFDVILLDKCHDHFFHIDCISLLINNKDNFKCPNCSIIYGILIGDMPKGSMSAYISEDLHCNGYKNIGTIIIDYYFPSGLNYSGTSRECYLPNNKEGKEILGLLKVAFDRKLTFTIGTSVTTGRNNTTVWNGIHHKTNTWGGPTCFGYPDDTYFNRVKEELAAKGVFKENIDKDAEEIADDLINNYNNYDMF